MKRAVVIGASSGLGQEVARLLLEQGYTLGVAARRIDRLEQLRTLAPDRVIVQRIDVTASDATQALNELIEKLGGMDLMFYASGVGKQNMELEPDIE
ncbi:MAG: SDR family NAD(P)-dependent oxidoreductase, partial [Muribaculaceae bacterium]|nr:SDR family NAD(P)-dependent oxidoreductase [Muribaculaceae bacterium]